ncbi:MAG: hypothetical protein U9O86_04140 [Campylobacterota bacterium]|nr:hypothetical protein [Campylobacterota bacterium]
MNNFEAKYMKIASSYLSDKIKELNVKPSATFILEEKKKSAIHKIVTGIFK